MAEFNHNIEIENGEESVDLKKIIYVFIHNWYWFLLFGILGFGIAFLYTRVSKQEYQAITSILLKDNNANGINVSDLFQGVISQPKNKVTDQMEIISSYAVVNKTLKSLDWGVSWFKKGFWTWDELYKDAPFKITEEPNFHNPTGGRIYITPISKTQYRIKVEDEFGAEPNQTEIDINAVGTYGKPFRDKYFHFTLSQKVPESDISGEQFYFVFNNIDAATLRYRKLINTTTLDRNNQSDVIVCSMKGREPEREVDFLNRLISTYIKDKLNIQNETQRKTLDFINGQLKEFSDSLNKASNRFVSFRATNKIIDLTKEGTIVLDSLSHIESSKADIQLQLQYYKNLQRYLRKPNDQQFVAPSVVGNKDALFNALVLQMNDLFNKKTILTFSANKDNPALALLNRQISQTRKQLQESVGNMVSNADQYLNTIKMRESLATKQLMKLPKKEQQMITLQNKYNMINQIYTFLLQKKAQTSITLASNVPDVQIIDVARIETTVPVGVSHKSIMLIGFILGFMVPGLFLLLRNFFDDRIRTQEEVENHTQLPILANIIHSPLAIDLAVYDNPKSNLSESFRAMRTNLQFMLDGKEGNVISIHSTNPSEGKSFTSVNLATILAMNNKSVVLIGADLRKPKLHKLFDVSNDKGLSTYLIAQNTVDDIIQPTKIENLSFIASGPIPPNPAEILGKPEMKKLIDYLRPRFDYIVMDNAPVGLVTDGIITSKLSDVNIFILRYGYSQRYNLEFINNQAARKNIEKVALVINDIKTSAFGYTYYKYYHYEYYQHSYYSEEEEGDRKRGKKKRKGKV